MVYRQDSTKPALRLVRAKLAFLWLHGPWRCSSIFALLYFLVSSALLKC